MTPPSLSTTLAGLGSHFTADRVSVRDILQALPRGSLEIGLFLFALVIALPLPTAPGMNSILAIPLLLITPQQIMGRHHIWLPEKIKSKSISRLRFEKITAAMLPWIRRGEYLLRPRLTILTEGPALRLIGIAGFIMACCIAVPFPLSNTVPSICIALMALGIIMHDGLAVLIGMLAGLIWVVALAWLGAEGVQLVINLVRDQL